MHYRGNRRRYMRFLLTAALFRLLLSPAARGADERFIGSYGTPGEHLIVVTRWGEDHYLLDMTYGRARRLAQEDELDFAYGPTRSSTEPIAGRIRFDLDDDGDVVGLTDSRAGERLPRVALTTRAVEFDNADAAHLAGTLVSPATEPRAWVLLLAGSAEER